MLLFAQPDVSHGIAETVRLYRSLEVIFVLLLTSVVRWSQVPRKKDSGGWWLTAAGIRAHITRVSCDYRRKKQPFTRSLLLAWAIDMWVPWRLRSDCNHLPHFFGMVGYTDEQATQIRQTIPNIPKDAITTSAPNPNFKSMHKKSTKSSSRHSTTTLDPLLLSDLADRTAAGRALLSGQATSTPPAQAAPAAPAAPSPLSSPSPPSSPSPRASMQWPNENLLQEDDDIGGPSFAINNTSLLECTGPSTHTSHSSSTVGNTAAPIQRTLCVVCLAHSRTFLADNFVASPP